MSDHEYVARYKKIMQFSHKLNLLSLETGQQNAALKI